MERMKTLRVLWIVSIMIASRTPAFGQARQDVDLIVSGGIVVTMDGDRAIYQDGSVAVRGDSIVAAGPRADIESRYHGKQTIDARGHLVLPGFVNGHTHVPMTLFRGLHDDVTLNDWLYKYIFPAEAKNVTEEFVRWGTRLAAAEQIRAGVTTFADMYYFEDAVAEETKAAGMRGVLGETFIDFPAPDNKSEAEMLAYTGEVPEKVAGRSADSRGSGSAFDLHMLEENAAGFSRAGEEVSCADSDPRLRDEKRVGGQRESERHVSRAVSGEDRGARSGRCGGALHFRRRGRQETTGGAGSRVRAQSIKQHDDREWRVPGFRDARGWNCGRPGDGWSSGK